MNRKTLFIISQNLICSLAVCVALVALGETNMNDKNSWSEQITEDDTIRKDTIRRDSLPRNRRRPNFRLKDRYGDPYSNRINTSPLLPKDPKNIRREIESDSAGNITIYEKIGGVDYRPPTTISQQQFSKLQNRNILREAWKKKNDVTGKQEAAEKRLFPKLYVGPAFDRIFGGSFIDFRPNGFVTLDFGGKVQRVDNPAFPVRQRKSGVFDFEQQISMNLTGKVGEKLKMTANFDTKSSFQFEQSLKLDYTGFEEDILQKIEAGNVSMPLNSTLITGAQNLFGLKAKLKFGKLTVTAIAANQRSRQDAVSIQSGVQTRNFEVKASDYEENKHFFLSQFFRDKYEEGLKTLPVINTGVQITRLEVYITNRTSNTSKLRNIVALMDLGESNKIYEKNKTNANYSPILGGGSKSEPADNKANNLFQSLSNSGTNIRNADNTANTLTSSFGLVKGSDFEVIRSTRKLDEKEYTYNSQLGYISLNTALRNDEVLSVSYQYTYQGRPYQVGELTENYQTFGDDDVIVLKLLRPSSIRVDLPTWNLMMKNIYSLGATQLNSASFQLRVIYKDDITGIDNPSLHEGTNLKNIPLVQVFRLDQLNQQRDPVPDGNFDYVEGITIDSQYGRVIFPVLEPFGSFLTKVKTPPYYFASGEVDLINKYVYSALYSTTRNQAQQESNKNKFALKGSYQSSASSSTSLGGLGVQDQSVTVTAGGVTLKEGTDYIVEGGQVTIINESIKASGKEIKISYEKPDLFQNQVRTLLGTRFEYAVDKDFTIGSTLMRLRERPTLTRVSVGDEPVNNTVLGFDVNVKKDSRLLTRLVDKLPLISTKELSNVTFNGEYARLFPGVTPYIRGNSYIDDFEGAETPYDLTRIPQQRWKLGATPLSIQNPQLSDSLPLTYKRAKLAWYSVDNIFYGGTGGTSKKPGNISDEDVKNHYVRQVQPQEIFKNKAQLATLPNQSLMDIAYYPDERGPYNYNTDLTADGKLKNPKTNFAAISRAVNYDVDFDNANIQYIEFWMLDPFLASSGDKYNIVAGKPANSNPGGDLYFNLGNISEDVVKDGRHMFENGLPADGNLTDLNVAKTSWGYAPRSAYLLNAFDNSTGARTNQDVGLDGLKSSQEGTFGNLNDRFIKKLPTNISAEARQKINSDPSADDFRNYLSTYADSADFKVLERYKDYNGLENNSPEGTDSQSYTSAATTYPDNEDLNTDNTISDLEEYYQYKVSLRKNDLIVGKNYIVDKVDTNIYGDNVSWYQFRIPIRENYEKVGSISGFKSIRFMRMYLTNFEQAVVLRMAQLQLVSNQWRPYVDSLSGSLYEKGIGEYPEPYDANFTVGTVSVEKNSSGNDVTTPYVLPPGAIRDRDITSINNPQLNEQSLKLSVTNLQDRDARAVYKNVNLDLLSYKNLKLFIHGETQDPKTRDGDLRAFVRLGTDFQDNYYEIEVSLQLTKLPLSSGQAAADPTLVWPDGNLIDVPYDELVNTKVERNNNGKSIVVPYYRAYNTRYRITVVGNPDLSSVQTLMIGIRNPQSADQAAKSGTIWADEMSSNGFNQTSGWAANARLNVKLADFANVSASYKHIGFGFGAISQKISERARENTSSWDISATINLDKMFPSKWGLKIPMFVSYEDLRIDPHYDPLDKDVPLEESLTNKNRNYGDEGGGNYKKLVEDRTTKRSLNFTNVQKLKMNKNAKSHLWDISNFSFTYAYSDISRSNINTAEYTFKNYHGGMGYNFSSQSKPFEPFKKAKWNSPWMKIIKDFNINLIPSSVSLRGDLDRRFIKTQLRNELLTTTGILPQYEKYFTFNRTYNVRWGLTKSINIDYGATANSVVDEPAGDIDTKEKRQVVWNNLKKLGRMKLFNQNIGATYHLPIDKFPLTDWLSADLQYNVAYNWTAGALYIADTLGNTIQNSRDRNVNSRIDLTKLYNKLKFLKSINDAAPSKAQNNIKNPPKTQAIPDNILVKKDPKDSIKVKRELKALKVILRALMTARTISFTYGLREQTMVSGFMPRAGFFGMDSTFSAPGWGFILGSQDPAMLETYARNGWLSKSAYLNSPFRQSFTEELSGQTALEPFKDFKITLTAKRSRGTNYEEYYRTNVNDPTGPFEHQSPSKNGSFSMSFIAIKTAFDKQDTNSSATFQKFLEYREVIQKRLSSENKNGGSYNGNSQDVLINAFVAAYSGKDPNKMKLNPFFGIPLPNWRLDYSGLSKIPSLKSIFSSVSITHGYNSTYNVGSYSSSVDYIDTTKYSTGKYGAISPTGLLKNSYQNPYLYDSLGYKPIYVFNSIIISERFAPLIGINLRTVNKMTINLQYNRSRDLILNLSNSQVTEQTSKDFTLSLGFAKTNLRLPFKVNGETRVLKNEITFRCDFTYREQRTIQRRTDSGVDPTPTGGNQNIQLKPSINYTVNQRLTMQAYFERQINNPTISTSYPRRNTNFGIQLRYSLTQ